MATGTFETDVERYRRELLAHCYQMLGSATDAEDAVQETMLRAWRAADRFDPARASLRTWLHRIATNVCLTMLEGRRRRPLPSGLGAPGEPDAALAPAFDVPWLQPLPSAAVDGGSGDPASTLLARGRLRLAFVAALQFLPARQRAVLVLRDVLEFPAAQVADMLDTTPAAVNSALQRARATMSEAAPDEDSLGEPADSASRDVVVRYAEAFERADIAGLARLLRDDVALEMPPVPLWLSGRDHYVRFIERAFRMRGTGWRMRPVEANGQPAVAAYAPVPDGGGWAFHTLQVFATSAGLIRRTVVFQDMALAGAFGVAPTMIAET